MKIEEYKKIILWLKKEKAKEGSWIFEFLFFESNIILSGVVGRF